jgi:hypothetical protein
MEASDLVAKTILDAGCRDGALLSLLGEHGADAIGIHISTSIAIPHECCKKHTNVAVLHRRTSPDHVCGFSGRDSSICE